MIIILQKKESYFVRVSCGYDTCFAVSGCYGFKEQNTLLRALWACPRVTKSPRAVGPRAFGHPSPRLQCVVVLDKCIDKSFVLL